MKNILIIISCISAFLCISFNAFSQEKNPVDISVDADNPGIEIQPTMWGLFYEDINFAADGGLYAELVKNRSFEFLTPMDGWTSGMPRNRSQMGGGPGGPGERPQMGGMPEGIPGENPQMGGMPEGGPGEGPQMGGMPEGLPGEGPQMGGRPEGGPGERSQMGGVPEGGFGFGSSSSSVLIVNRGSNYANNPRVAQITVDGNAYLTNSGFRGMGIHGNEEYLFSVMTSVKSGNIKINVRIIGADGQEIGSTIIDPDSKSWKKYETKLMATKTDAKASLRLHFEGNGVIEIDMVSLFPVNTWNKRRNGLRTDLVQKLADLEPGFIRFPGGCIVEGRDLTKRYQWKNTIGNVEDRKLIINRWNDENSRATSDYFQTFGLGFYEYFLLAEDLGAEPLPVVNCGMACQFNTAEVVALEAMDSYVQDALDLIEFANGPADSEWGKIRAEMGHPEPFNMKYLGIGNEQWGRQYFERYELFEKAIMEKYPDIMIVSTAGPMAAGPFFNTAVEELKNYHAALVDEHYYSTPDWFYNNISRYDDYNRNTYKIFLGEYAANNVGMANEKNINTWETALAEAAYMTGLERNADVVYMASYAPLLAHVDAWQWTPDLIWFNNLTSYGTPNYYVQKLFATNKGSHLLNTQHENKQIKGEKGLYATSVWDEEHKEIILKIVNSNEEAVPLNISLNTKKKLSSEAELITLKSENLGDMNSFENPGNIVPAESEIATKGKKINLTVDPYSLSVIKIKQK